jgi:hypothetical protein
LNEGAAIEQKFSAVLILGALWTAVNWASLGALSESRRMIQPK